MPRAPKIPRDQILRTALDIVLRDGYPSLTIKSLARALGCSTAPISWQFGGMEGLRRELIRAADDYRAAHWPLTGRNALETFEQTGRSLVRMALDAPNLFRFLFMGESGQRVEGGFWGILDDETLRQTCGRLATLLSLSQESAEQFLSVMILYTQGLGTLIASGMVTDDRATIERMLRRTAAIHLRGLGVEEDTIERLLPLHDGDDARTSDKKEDPHGSHL